jgi:hypothetical protein
VPPEETYPENYEWVSFDQPNFAGVKLSVSRTATLNGDQIERMSIEQPEGCRSDDAECRDKILARMVFTAAGGKKLEEIVNSHPAWQMAVIVNRRVLAAPLLNRSATALGADRAVVVGGWNVGKTELEGIARQCTRSR